MFNLDYETITYHCRWEKTFDLRLSNLREHSCRVAYIYETPDVSTFRYRVYNVVNVINEQLDEVSASYFFLNDLVYMEKILERCDVLVLCRMDYCHKVAQLIMCAKSRNIRVVYDVDDLVFDTEYAHLILNTLDKNLEDTETWNYWFSYISRKGEVLKLCDSAITTNPFLGKLITEFAGIPCYEIPNFFNREQFEVSKNIMEQKIRNSFARTETFTMGYFSGSSTHNWDFDLLSESLIRLFNKHSNIVLYIVGFIDLKGKMKNYTHRIEFLPFHDYVNLQHLMASVDVNLIPLQNNTFTNCKSELKYFEAAIGGTVSIASPTYIYKNVIKDGVNGFTAQDYTWEEKIQNLMYGLEEYPEIAENAYNHALKNYAWFNQGKKINFVFEEIARLPVN